MVYDIRMRREGDGAAVLRRVECRQRLCVEVVKMRVGRLGWWMIMLSEGVFGFAWNGCGCMVILWNCEGYFGLFTFPSMTT